MRGMRLDRRPDGVEAALQFAGEQQVRQLGLAVGRPGQVWAGLPVQILEADVADQVHHRRHRDHPVGDLGQQQVGQREVAEVVGPDLAFEPVDGQGVRHRHDAGVVDQNVDAVDAVGELPHRRQVLQIEPADLDSPVMPAAAALPLSRLRTATMTLAPTRASSRAVTSPRPLLAPVTMTVRPENEGRSAAVQSLMAATLMRRCLGYFAATLNPRMMASMSGASSAAFSA